MFVDTSIKGANFQVGKSLRFRAAATAGISRTPATNGNRQKWTWSGWVKRGKLGSGDVIVESGDTAGTYYTGLRFNTSDQLYFLDGISGSNPCLATSTRLFRDTSAWYHFVLVVDTTNAVASERVQIYANGVRVAMTFSATYSQNSTTQMNSTSYVLRMGKSSRTDGFAVYSDLYLAEVNYVDGLSLTPYSFGQTNVDTGVWEPIRYTGTYGTNGFYLPFTDGSSLTALCSDVSGNGNNFTSSGVSLTVGSTYDWMSDTPTNNYATINPIVGTSAQQAPVTNGLLTATGTATTQNNSFSTMPLPTSGKWYWEIECVNSATYGISVGVTSQPAGLLGTDPNSYSYYNASGNKYAGATASAYGSVWWGAARTDVLGVSYNAETGALSFYLNGVSQGVAFTLDTTKSWYPAASHTSGTGSTVQNWNFGQRPFSYAVPAGFNTLCSANLPDSAVPRGEKYFKARTYVGNGGGLQVGEVQKAIDLVSIGQSLRFNSADSSYLSRTMAAGNRRKFTWSGWVKRTNMASNNVYLLFNAIGSTGSDYSGLRFNTDDTLQVYESGGLAGSISTTAKFRDANKWYHVVYVFDSANATTADRQQLWVDGIRQGVTGTPVTQNFDSCFNRALQHTVGVQAIYNMASGGYFDGYMADVNFVDGYALTPSSFGQWDANGYWVPAAPSVADYGTNGFRLTFSDSSAATAAAIGKDTSGKGNNWTPSGLSVAAGVSAAAMIDSPTNSYWSCHGNLPQYMSVSGGGLLISYTSTYIYNPYGWGSVTPPLPKRGLWYYEQTTTTSNGEYVGLYNRTKGTPIWTMGYYGTAAGVYSFAVDTASGKVWGRYNAALPADLSAVTPDAVFDPNDDVTVMVGTAWNYGGAVYHQFGQFKDNAATAFYPAANGFFRYAPPSGYRALCENNVAEYVDDLETPDLVWIKGRSGATGHMLFDTTRGAGKYLSSNATAAEATDVNSLVQFNKNGFYLGNNANVNTLNATYAAWTWKAGGAPVANASGSIASQVSASQKAGISVVSFTGTGVTGTVGHGLGAVPSMIIVKCRSSSPADWPVYHKSLTSGYSVFLSTTNAQTSGAWFPTAPTSQVFTAGYPSNISINSSGLSYIAYCFAEVPGFSKFGSYTGNGAVDGPFVNLGFRPAFVMIKNIADGTAAWLEIDSARETSNPNGRDIYLNRGDLGEQSPLQYVDLVSNGFKVRNSNPGSNGSGQTLIYAAFAENPFKNANAR